MRGIASRPFRLRGAAACSNGGWRPEPAPRGDHCGRSGPVGSARPLSGAIGEEPKTVPEPFQSAAALFRPCRPDHPAAQPIVHCRWLCPSRRRIVRHAVEGPFFRAAKREGRANGRAPAVVEALAR